MFWGLVTEFQEVALRHMFMKKESHFEKNACYLKVSSYHEHGQLCGDCWGKVGGWSWKRVWGLNSNGKIKGKSRFLNWQNINILVEAEC